MGNVNSSRAGFWTTRTVLLLLLFLLLLVPGRPRWRWSWRGSSRSRRETQSRPCTASTEPTGSDRPRTGPCAAPCPAWPAWTTSAARRSEQGSSPRCSRWEKSLFVECFFLTFYFLGEVMHWAGFWCQAPPPPPPPGLHAHNHIWPELNFLTAHECECVDFLLSPDYLWKHWYRWQPSAPSTPNTSEDAECSQEEVGDRVILFGPVASGWKRTPRCPIRHCSAPPHVSALTHMLCKMGHGVVFLFFCFFFMCKWIQSGQVVLAHVQVTLHPPPSLLGGSCHPLLLFVTPLFTCTEADFWGSPELPHAAPSQGLMVWDNAQFKEMLGEEDSCITFPSTLQ